MAAAAAAVSVTASSSDAPNGKATDLRSTFEQVYNHLKSELLEDPAFDFTYDSRQWIERMLDHNVPGVDSYRLLRQGMEISTDEVFLGCVLGWCIEWLQAYFLVLDDIMDGSLTRRGQPCWFRVPKAKFLERPDVTNPHVGYMKWPKLFNSLLRAVSLPLYLLQLVEWRVGFIAVNDGVLLRNHIPRILKRHFREKPYYVDLLDLFNEVEFQTASGQMLDLITTHEGEKDLSKYKMPVYRRIVQYKTAYYSFYLPVACALVMSGENLENFINVKNILIDMGTYFQVQDDYLDCFGDPQVIGKIGTDIEDFKCSWLVVQALERADENEKKILSENYGKPGSEHVASVKTLYKDLELQAVFLEYERESYERLTASIDALPSKSVQEVLKSFLGKIYKRQK